MDLQLRHKLDLVFNSIEDARKKVSQHHIVKILAVTKYSDDEVIKKLYEIGQRAFGENKIQDLEQKNLALQDLPLEWHFIGSLQKNKINKLIALKPHLFQSLHSIELAEQLNQRLEKQNQKMNVLLQINSADEVQKFGISSEMAIDSYHEISERFPNIVLKGLMAVTSKDKIQAKKSFQETYKIFDSLKKSGAKTLSMGMSGDFEIAISEGANMIRLGSILIK